MAKIYLTDEHYFQCASGLFPARMYDGKSTHVSKTGKHYLTHYDTATKTPDFTCKWAVVLAVAAAVFFALLASNPIGWAILAGLIVGLAGGFCMCGVMMASGRKWINYERHVVIKKAQYALTNDSYMTCPIGGVVTWSPEISSPGIALWTGLRNTGFATLEGIMYGYAAYGATSLFTGAGLQSAGINFLKGWARTYGRTGLLMRTGFAAENVTYRNVTGQYEDKGVVDMMKDAGKTFGGDIYQYYNIGSKLANGEHISTEEIANSVATPLSFIGLNIQMENTADTQIPKNIRELSENLSNKIGGLFKRGNKVSSLELMEQREQQAIKFYQEHNPNMDISDIRSHISGIDFSQPVEIVKIKGGTELIQYTKVNSEGTILRGDYYTDNPTHTPSQLGVSDKYNVQTPNRIKTSEVKEVAKETVVIPNDVEGLKSTSAEINDTWSRIDTNGNKLPVHTEGGGSQIYIPKSQFK